MTFEQSANLISPQQWNPRASTPQQFKRLLLGSFCLHLAVLMALMGLRFPSSHQALPPSYEVTLIALDEMASLQRASATQQKVPTQKVAKPAPPVPLKQEIAKRAPAVLDSPPAPREKLAEAIAQSLETVVVPPERSVSHVRTESPSPLPQMPKERAGLEKLSPPPAVPELALGRHPSSPQQASSKAAPVPMEHPSGARENLVGTITESLETIVVPQERSVSHVRTESPSPLPQMPKERAGLEKLSPPPAVPELEISQSSPPRSVASTPEIPKEKLSETLAKTMQAVKDPPVYQKPRQTTNSSVSQRLAPKDQDGSTEPLLPQAPAWKPLDPIPRTSRNQNPPVKTGQLSDTLKELVQSVQVPTAVQPQMAKPATSEVPVVKASRAEARKPIAESLKDVVQAVPIPKPWSRVAPVPAPPRGPREESKPTDNASAQALAALKEVIPPPQVPHFTKVEPAKASKPSPDAQAVPLHAHLDQQIAKLVIPEVNDVPKTSRVGESLNNIASRTTKALQLAGGDIDGNPYWARVRARIDREWIAAPVDVPSNQPIQVLVAFRLERSGSVKNVKIVRSSGNTFFDLAAQRAVLAADPLPAFPTELSESHVDLQFQFTVRKDGP